MGSFKVFEESSEGKRDFLFLFFSHLSYHMENIFYFIEVLFEGWDFSPSFCSNGF